MLPIYGSQEGHILLNSQQFLIAETSTQRVQNSCYRTLSDSPNHQDIDAEGSELLFLNSQPDSILNR